MSSQSDIAQQFIDGGVVPADLVGQQTVSRVYVDGKISSQNGEIAIIASLAASAQNTANVGVSNASTAQSTANIAVGAAGMAQHTAEVAQSTVDTHKESPKAHDSLSITYSGHVAGASSVKQAIDLTKQRVDNIVASGGTSNIEIVDARQPATGNPFPTLSARLINVDAQLADIAQEGINIMSLPFGAVGDKVTDNAAKINAAANVARTTGKALIIPSGDFLVASSLDFTGLLVRASGEGCKILATSAEFDVLISKGNTIIENLFIHGGWDGITAGLTGHILRIEDNDTAFISNVHIRNCWFQFAKQDTVYGHNFGYSSFKSVKGNAAGRHGLHLEGDSGANAVTTISVDNSSTFSDCPNGFGVRIKEGVNITIKNVISEHTKGFELAGNDNRNVEFIGCYQENTSTGKYITWTGAGQSINISGGFAGGTAITYSANFIGVNILGLSNYTIADPDQCYNWSMVQFGVDVYVNSIRSMLGVNAKNTSGASTAHILDTALLPNASDVLLSLRNNGNETHRFKASGGFKTGADWQFGHLELGDYHLWIDANSSLRIKGSAPTSGLDGNIIAKWVNVPPSPTSFGIEGQMAKDNAYLYICTQNSNWTRTPLTSW